MSGGGSRWPGRAGRTSLSTLRRLGCGVEAVVHLAAGASAGLLALVVVRQRPRAPAELVVVGCAALWGLPDVWWFLSSRRPIPSYHAPVVAETWKAAHGSPVANVFWGHRVLDRHETGHAVLEAQVAVLVCAAVGCVYLFVRRVDTRRVAASREGP